MNTDVLVLGGGPAGMMAALTAARSGANVALLEPMERLGKKLNITGKGRCNLTNCCSQEDLMRNVPCNGKFLFSAFSQWDSKDTMAFFEELGVPLKTERGNRVFPLSDRAFDVSGALERALRRERVSIRKDRGKALILENGAVRAVVGEQSTWEAPAVVVATGGLSYPATGSTGDGYRLAESAGHTIVPPRGSLVPLCAAGELCGRLQGLSLRNVALTVYENDKELYRDFGELLFTHFGVSGPLVLSASAHMRRFGGARYRLVIDLKPALDELVLDRRLVSDFRKYANRDLVNALDNLLPKKLIEPFVALSGLDPRQKARDLTREQRRKILSLLKGLPVDITGPRPVEEAIVTSGGVSVKEVTPSTMESQLCKGLYFAGEVLDVDAYTGGFNLQIAWSTGYVAGKSAAQRARPAV